MLCSTRDCHNNTYFEKNKHIYFENFRPVSNFLLISKLIEQNVALQLNKYIEENCLGEILQSAKKKIHSTELKMAF